MLEELKKCPFCGGAATLNIKYAAKSQAWYVSVKCEVCYSESKIFKSYINPTEVPGLIEQAKAAWNHRVNDEDMSE